MEKEASKQLNCYEMIGCTFLILFGRTQVLCQATDSLAPGFRASTTHFCCVDTWWGRGGSGDLFDYARHLVRIWSEQQHFYKIIFSTCSNR